MNEQDLTLERKREKSLAVMACITKVFQQDYQQAMANVEKTEQQLLDHQKKTKCKGIFGFVLNLILKFFVNSDMPVYLPEKGDYSDVQRMIEQGKCETKRGYAELFSLLDRITKKMESSDEAVEKGYAVLKSVADLEQNIAQALMQISSDMAISLTALNRKFIDLLKQDAGDLAKLRECVRAEI